MEPYPRGAGAANGSAVRRSADLEFTDLKSSKRQK